MPNQSILILDFGGQYKELIARRVRECHVHSQILPGSTDIERIRALQPIGIILTGGPDSVYRDGAPRCDRAVFELGIPVLGICYGLQLMAYTLGGRVSPCTVSEYGRTQMQVEPACPLFSGMDPVQTGLMSHTDQVFALPEGFRSAARTAHCPHAAGGGPDRRL